MEELRRIEIVEETEQVWSNCVEHAKEEERRFWELDGFSDQVVEHFMFTVNTGESSDSETSSGSSDIEEIQ